MTWVRKDDQMPIHRKVAPLTDAAYRLNDEAICWSSRNLADGRISVDDLAGISKRGKPNLAAELVRRGLWHEAGHVCPSPTCPPSGPDGWVIHDYLEYNPSKEKVLRERDAKAERQRRWIDAKKGRKDATKDATRDASQDTPLTHAQRDANPAPPRPEESGAGGPAPSGRRPPASGGRRGRRPEQDHTVGHPPSGNGRPPGPPPDYAQLKADALAKARAASDARRGRDRRRADPLAELGVTTTDPTPKESPDAPSAA